MCVRSPAFPSVTSVLLSASRTNDFGRFTSDLKAAGPQLLILLDHRVLGQISTRRLRKTSSTLKLN